MMHLQLVDKGADRKDSIRALQGCVSDHRNDDLQQQHHIYIIVQHSPFIEAQESALESTLK